MPDAAHALLASEIPHGFRVDSARIPVGVRTDSASHARARARDPYPYPSRRTYGRADGPRHVVAAVPIGGQVVRTYMEPGIFAMTELDRVTFDRAFRRVCGAFRLKVKEGELEELSRTYFRILETAPLEDVLAAAKNCLATCHKFPKPAEWLQALPVPPAAASRADLRVMGTTEREEYARAEGLRYEGAPCGCLLCQEAEITYRPLRFVPDEILDVLDKAFDTVRNREVITGHWAHGEELARWYVARDAFYASTPRRGPMARVLALVGGDREPGCDDD